MSLEEGDVGCAADFHYWVLLPILLCDMGGGEQNGRHGAQISKGMIHGSQPFTVAPVKCIRAAQSIPNHRINGMHPLIDAKGTLRCTLVLRLGNQKRRHGSNHEKII